MRARHESWGYSIVEVMLFLAISGFMFVIAAAFVGGKQSKSEFRQGINDLNMQVQQVINDVSNGFYPSSNNFKCEDIGSGAPPRITAGANAAGTGGNRGCIFLGKVIQFSTNGSNDTGYDVYTVAGRQYKVSATDGELVTSFADAKPVAVCGTSAANCSNTAIDITDKKALQWGVRSRKITSAGTPINGVGFFGSFGTYSNAALQSGSQNVVVVAIPGTDPARNELPATMAADIAAQVNDANVVTNPDILICLDNGKRQYGTLRIGGGNGQRLSTAVQIAGSTPISGCPA